MYPSAPPPAAAAEIHGLRVEDPHRALEDASDPVVQRWIAAQQDLADRWFSIYRVTGLDDALGRLDQGFYGLPTDRGTRTFTRHRPAGAATADLVELRDDGLWVVVEGGHGADRGGRPVA